MKRLVGTVSVQMLAARAVAPSPATNASAASRSQVPLPERSRHETAMLAANASPRRETKATRDAGKGSSRHAISHGLFLDLVYNWTRLDRSTTVSGSWNESSSGRDRDGLSTPSHSSTE